MFFLRFFMLSVLIISSLSLSASPISDENITVRFATEANYYPFEYFNNKSEIQGFDIDIANAICNVANLTCSFHYQSFDSLLYSLQFGRFDAVISALDITEERLKKVDFSESYYKEPPVFVSRRSAEKEFSIAEKFIGVKAHSSNQDYLINYANENSFSISYFSSAKAFTDLQDGKIDAVFVDYAVAEDFLQKENNLGLFSIQRTEQIFLKEFSKGYGIAVKKGNRELQDRLDLGLKIILANGAYKKIYKSYFE